MPQTTTTKERRRKSSQKRIKIKKGFIGEEIRRRWSLSTKFYKYTHIMLQPRPANPSCLRSFVLCWINATALEGDRVNSFWKPFEALHGCCLKTWRQLTDFNARFLDSDSRMCAICDLSHELFSWVNENTRQAIFTWKNQHIYHAASWHESR